MDLLKGQGQWNGEEKPVQQGPWAVHGQCMHVHQAQITDWAQALSTLSSSEPPPVLLQLIQHSKPVDGTERFLVFRFISSFKL